MTTRRVTIRDVAREAQVSISTVSRVLNGGPTVNPAMAGQVRAVAQRLGYRPNPAAQGLASGTYGAVGAVVPDLGNPFFSDILKATVAAASLDGYRMMVGDSGGSPDEELAACQQQLSNVDGLILLSPRMDSEQLAGLVGESSSPIVLVNRLVPDVDIPTIVADTYGAMLKLCQYLATLGHRRVVYLGGAADIWQQIERRRAVEDASRFGLDAVHVECGGTIRDGYHAAERASEHEPTAILAFNDLAAFGLITRLTELGVRVPDDISVTGFDDIEMARIVRPALTTVMNPTTELGRLAWLAMRDSLRGRSPRPTSPVPSPLVIRDSTGPARTRR